VKLDWSNESKIILESNSAEAWSKDWPNRADKNISMENFSKNFNWLSTWTQNHFKKILEVLIPYLLILMLIYLYFKYKYKYKYLFDLKFVKLSLIVSLLGSFVFFLKFPIYRYGYSYIISSFILISILFIRFYDYEKIKKICIFAFFIFIISFVYKQTDRYIEYHSKRNLIPEIYNTEKKYKKIMIYDNSFYNLTMNPLCMYDVNLCTPYPNNKLMLKTKEIVSSKKLN